MIFIYCLHIKIFKLLMKPKTDIKNIRNCPFSEFLLHNIKQHSSYQILSDVLLKKSQIKIFMIIELSTISKQFLLNIG